ncbi:hypothetical protein [Nonomuraea sp. NPDC050643]|uniref:hypothetical protein n=1 Tax=Nonomuraea sp. NPDC050643 TaxID=3155660 RepID=UPI0033EACE8A
MFLALAVLTIITVRYVRNDRVVQMTGAVWLVFNVLHLIYHMQHLHMYETSDQVLNVIALSSLVVLSLVLLVPSLPGRRDDTR